MKLSKTMPVMIILIIIISVTFSGYAQDKTPFTINDFGRWRSITSTSISDNGNWVTYAYRTPNADDTLFVENLLTGKKFEIPGGSRPMISDDEKWAAYVISIPFKKAEKLRKDKKPVPQKVQLLNLVTEEEHTVENASNFSFSKGSKFFTVKKAKADPKAKLNGTNMLLWNLEQGFSELLGSVNEFSFNKPGTILAYTVDAVDSTGNGLYMIDLNNGSRKPLDTGNAVYEKLKWDEEGTALAVLKGKLKKGYKQRDNVLLAFTGFDKGKISSSEFDPSAADNFPENMVVSEKGNLSWNENADRLFFGIKEQEIDPEKEKDAKPVADVDVWRWNDERIQSAQMITANRDRNFTYRSVFLLDNNKFVRLADESMRTISVARNGKWGVGQNNKPYISDWKENRADYYRVEISTGERTLMFKGQKRTLGISPDSKRFLYWKDGHIRSYQIESGKMINLTDKTPVSFVNTEYDRGGTKPPYGITGWSKDGKSVLLNHKYDIWLQPLDGKEGKNLTGGEGAKNEIRFRYVRTDREERFIDVSKTMLLTAYGQWTKKAGLYSLKKGKLEKLVLEDKRFGRVTKAKNADKFMYTIESPVDFPNISISGASFNSPRRITDANPWQSEYKWGHNELIEYTNKDGVRLQGVLMIPDDYRQGQKLPMLVDFYEKNSQNLNRYSRLIYRDTPMFYKYVSNGYLVLLPDVHFNLRSTHSDMLECVEAAVQKVIDLGYVDPARVGLHGHSFSGQGSAYIAGRSKMFAAIVAGAAATDLVADFNQLWKSSGTNQHRYDYYGQGRFMTNPYEDFELYRHESGVTHAPTMDTPLLLFHGTADGSVEWLQAVEFYNALRFNGKNVILISYPGQGHHLNKLENKIDFQTRMEEFYDHYLKGKPAPDWITKGVPFLKKKK